MRTRPTALGAYIFAGGFTVGVSKHFDVQAHLEESDYGVATVAHNMPELPVYYGMDQWPVELLRSGPRIDFLYGNPPCAAWSPAGSKIKAPRHWQSDPRVDCTRRHFGLLDELRPHFWAWESVPQAFVMGRSFVDELTVKALDMGYSVTYVLHNAMYLGAPQKRRRFFFVAHDVEFDVANLTWEWQTCDDALRGMNDRGIPLDHNIKKYPDIIAHVRPNETLISAWGRFNPESGRKFNARGQTVGRPCFTIKRLQAGQPAPVVMHELIHPTEHRGISIKEVARLCGFPPDYEFINAKDVGQVSRGVCPPVGEWLARNVARCLRHGRAVTEPSVRLVDVREPPGSVIDLPWPTREGEVKQVHEVRKGVDPDREFDTTSLREGAHGQWVHRDYGAHFFRWGWAGRFVNSEVDVLDVGCGPDVPMINALTMPRNNVPRSYTGVDMNREPTKHPTRGWATLLWEFDFTKRYQELGQFDLVTCFEAIEHMSVDDGLKLLKAMRACLRPGGKILLSTPVFSGKAAKNHIHEYTVEELTASVERAGLHVERRFGTFANSLAVKKVAKGPELELVQDLRSYYSDEVLSCFLAPLYPDASRNNAWILGDTKMAKSATIIKLPPGLPDKDEGEGSGAYMRRLLAAGAADDAILERVHAQFPGSKATKSDVAYNKAKLRKDGAPPVIVEARAPKYASKIPFDGGVSSAQAVSALRASVNKRATVPGLAALLNLSLDLMEKL